MLLAAWLTLFGQTHTLRLCAELPLVPWRHLERPHPSAAWTSAWPTQEQDPSFPQNAAEPDVADGTSMDPRQLAKQDTLAGLLQMQVSTA